MSRVTSVLFRVDRDAEPVLLDKLEGPAGYSELALERIVRVRHRPDAHNAFASARAQLAVQDGERIELHPHLVEVLDAVAIAAAVAVDAAVRAPPVQVHVVVDAEPLRIVVADFLEDGFRPDRFHGCSIPE